MIIMALPVTKEIARKRGDTKPFRFTLKKNGTDEPLAGYSFVLTVNAEAKPVDATQQQFSIAGSNDSDGNFSFIPSTSEANLLGTFYYDVQMTTPVGLVYTLFQGKMKFTQDITK